jgi:hypothetical protein
LKVCEAPSMEDDLEEKTLIIIDNDSYSNEC